MTKYKRWYDYDPMLLEVIEMLRFYQDELREQAKIFLEKVLLRIQAHVYLFIVLFLQFAMYFF